MTNYSLIDLKLIDFGMAHMADSSSSCFKGPCGTAGYQAPEIILGQAHIHSKGDVFALGVILYHMITGEMPIQGKDIPTLNKNTINKKIKFNQKAWKQCSPDVKELCKSMINKNPEQRLEVSQVLFDKWFIADELELKDLIIKRKKQQ